MTGFKLNWNVDKPTLVATSSEVRRSIQTPGFGATFDKLFGDTSDHKAVLTVPGDFQEQIENETLVIELVVNGDPNQTMYGFKSFRLYKEKKTRVEAEDVCKTEGGHLASIRSSWEQRQAVAAADENVVWLGGKQILGSATGIWQWVDSSPWEFTNWQSDFERGTGKWDLVENGSHQMGSMVVGREKIFFFFANKIPPSPLKKV